MIRACSYSVLIVLIVSIIATVHINQVVADTVPLASSSGSGEGDFSVDSPTYSFTWNNALPNSSMWTTVAAGATAGFSNTSVVGVAYKLTFQNDPEGTAIEVLEIGFAVLDNLTLPFVVSIPPCSTYNNVTLGDKVGNWTVSLTFTNVSSVPEDFVVHASVEIGSQETLLALPQTTYSQQIQSIYTFNTLEFAAFNASYSSLNAVLTISDLSDSTLEWLEAVELTQSQCVWNDPLSFAVNTTNTNTTIALNSVQSGVWQIRIHSKWDTTKDKATVGISWEVTGYNPTKQDDNKSWWTTEHIIYVSLAAAGGILLLVIIVGVVIWLVKRKGSYEEV